MDEFGMGKGRYPLQQECRSRPRGQGNCTQRKVVIAKEASVWLKRADKIEWKCLLSEPRPSCVSALTPSCPRWLSPNTNTSSVAGVRHKNGERKRERRAIKQEFDLNVHSTTHTHTQTQTHIHTHTHSNIANPLSPSLLPLLSSPLTQTNTNTHTHTRKK